MVPTKMWSAGEFLIDMPLVRSKGAQILGWSLHRQRTSSSIIGRERIRRSELVRCLSLGLLSTATISELESSRHGSRGDDVEKLVSVLAALAAGTGIGGMAVLVTMELILLMLLLELVKGQTRVSLLIFNLLLLMVVVSGLYIVRQHWRCFLSGIMGRNQVVSLSKAHRRLLLLLLLLMLLLMVKGLLLVLAQRILLNVSVIIAHLIRVAAVRRLVGTMRLTKGLEAMNLALSKILSRILLVWVVSPDRFL